jgi:ABC-2 type transport system ATP-binding protein
VVLQSASDFAEVTVAEVVRHFAVYYAAPRDPDEIMELVGLAGKRDTRTRRLSGGQRRRLDVALGILGNPELLFLDEPTTGFDPEARRQFWRLIGSLRAEGVTILLTTHYLDEAEALADRVGVIANGHIVEVGPPATLGGRNAAKAQVSWRGPNGTESVRTDTPTHLVQDLATRFGGEIPELSVARPTLEDVYLSMIGAQT